MRINLKFLSGLICLAITLSLGSCKSKKTATTVGGQKGQDLSVLLTDKEQISSMQSQLQISAKGMTVKGDLRIVKNKAIYLSVQAFLGIEVARMRFTPDSVIILDRLNRRYFADSFTRVGAVSGKTFSFSIVQALFLNQIFCPGKAYLSNIKEDDFLKSAEVDNLITLSPRKNENIQFRINSQRQLIQTKATGDAGRLSFQWNYNEFAAASKIIFPNRMEIDLTTSKNKLTGSMVFSRIEWNKPLNTECAIPSRYSRVEASEIFKLISTM